MKRLEDIELMEAEELEAAANEQNARVPEGLQERLEASLLAAAMEEESSPRRTPRWIPLTAIAAAAALAAVVALPRHGNAELKDTFDDPYLAYAQVEKAFQKISDKMAIGVNAAVSARSAAEKPLEIMNKINEK